MAHDKSHWRGEIVDSVDKALGLARSMTYRGTKPTVRGIARTYRKGISYVDGVLVKICDSLVRRLQLTPCP